MSSISYNFFIFLLFINFSHLPRKQMWHMLRKSKMRREAPLLFFFRYKLNPPKWEWKIHWSGNSHFRGWRIHWDIFPMRIRTLVTRPLGVTFLVRISHFSGVIFHWSGSSHFSGSKNLAPHFNSHFSGFRKKSPYIFILNSFYILLINKFLQIFLAVNIYFILYLRFFLKKSQNQIKH